jgi:hypothetical protein
MLDMFSSISVYWWNMIKLFPYQQNIIKQFLARYVILCWRYAIWAVIAHSFCSFVVIDIIPFAMTQKCLQSTRKQEHLQYTDDWYLQTLLTKPQNPRLESMATYCEVIANGMMSMTTNEQKLWAMTAQIAYLQHKITYLIVSISVISWFRW